jgi:Zn finger protein HypA/HybF involved in hydrogenase expression
MVLRPLPAIQIGAIIMNENVRLSCPNCNSQEVEIHSDGSGYCLSCKTSFLKPQIISIDSQIRQTAEIYCRKCGTLTSMPLCPQCGTALYCNNCKSPDIRLYQDKDIKYEYCANCGKNLEVISEKVPKVEPEWECSNCGAFSHDSDKKCPKCGMSFKEDKIVGGKNFKKSKKRIVIVVVALLIVVSLVGCLSYVYLYPASTSVVGTWKGSGSTLILKSDGTGSWDGRTLTWKLLNSGRTQSGTLGCNFEWTYQDELVRVYQTGYTISDDGRTLSVLWYGTTKVYHRA